MVPSVKMEGTILLLSWREQCVAFPSNKCYINRLSRKKVWSRLLYLSPSRNTYAAILSFILYFGSYFFSKKVSKKTAPKEIVAGPPLLVRQENALTRSEAQLVISVYDCFKGAADRPHLVACKQASK